MKPFPVLFALLAIGSAGLQAHANPRGLGPSAIEAARLKTYPPGGYLSHYLPDDRYKIAGNVWKYVSTDLDTYYHVPSSPNMMRQPAGRVIGFASAADAEEAGYTADPSDGTAGRAMAAMQTAPPATVSGGTTEEARYLGRILPLLQKSQSDANALGQRLSATMQSSRGRTSLAGMQVVMRRAMGQLQRQTRATSADVARVRPPLRYRRFHSLLLQTLRDSTIAVSALNSMATTGNLGTLMGMQGRFKQMQVTQLQLRQEAERLGLASQIPGLTAPTLPAR